ncbi:MAG: NAAT family transporter [Phycisphaerales bacterium]|nr:MAG: NAAT family transporter [Phycisphaerales bacterium]
MGVFFEYLLITIAAIFVIVNPLTTAFIFVSLIPHAGEKRRRATAKRAVIVSTGIFFTFALLGGVIFQLFGITLEAFRIAGGIILFGIAMGMIRKGQDESEQDGEEEDSDQPSGKKGQDVSIIPLAIPFISGPGSIATVMILTSEAPSIWHLGIVFLAILITTITCYYAMVYSRFLVKYMGETGKEIATKLFGLILSVIAVQFVINGIHDVYRGLPARTAEVTPIDPADEYGTGTNQATEPEEG